MNRMISYACSMMVATAAFAEMRAAQPNENSQQEIAKRDHSSRSSKKKLCPLTLSPENQNTSCTSQPIACEEYLQGRPLPEDKYLAGYNAPASIKLEECGNTFYADGSYLYWHASESDMNLADSFIATSATTGVPQSQTDVLSQPFHYQAGFKAGVGLETDNWSIDANYIWIRQNTSVSAAAPIANPSVGTGVWFIDNWYIQAPTPGVLASTVSSKWQLRMDVGDLVLGRSFYVGPRLIAAPYGGLRGALIRQSLRIASTETIIAATPLYPVVSHNRSKAWAVGPKMGSEFSYLLGLGFRLEGTMAASLLYERYKKVTHREDTTQTTDLVTNPILKISNFSTIAPVLEMGLGLGWNWYWDHFANVDLSATYDFGVWWRQNYMRKIVSSYLTGGSYPGELFLHGVTATLKFAF